MNTQSVHHALMKHIEAHFPTDSSLSKEHEHLINHKQCLEASLTHTGGHEDLETHIRQHLHHVGERLKVVSFLRYQESIQMVNLSNLAHGVTKILEVMTSEEPVEVKDGDEFVKTLVELKEKGDL